MATLDLQEQEQIDAFKHWWKDNGKGVIVAAALALGAVAAAQMWQSYKAGQASQAATMFGELNRQLGSGDPKRINDAAAAVTDKYASSAFAPRAQLLAAQANIDAGDAAHAKAQLQWVIEHADEDGLKDVARLKLAALLLDEKNYADALAQLDARHPESFDSLYADLRGDVLSAQGKVAEARVAYQQAYDKADAKRPFHNLIQMKLDALGGAK